jgi:hypothetical protein
MDTSCLDCCLFSYDRRAATVVQCRQSTRRLATMTAVTRLPAIDPAVASGRRKAGLVGIAFGLFSLGALATALVLDGPAGPPCADCAVVEAVSAVPGAPVRLKLRMPDGSVRSVSHRQALAIGTDVRVDADGALR